MVDKNSSENNSSENNGPIARRFMDAHNFNYEPVEPAGGVARFNILMAQAMYDDDGENKTVNDLIRDAVYLEFKELELNDERFDDAGVLNDWAYLLGSDFEYPKNSKFAQHIQNRTMDLLMEMEEALEQRLEGVTYIHDDRSTHYSSTYKTQASDNLKNMNKALEEDKMKVTLLLDLIEQSYNLQRTRALHIDG